MNPPIEVLYALPSNLYAEQAGYVKTAPVVRYSDHCAVVEKLNALNESWKTLAELNLQQVEQLTATCERLQAELTVAKYGQQAVNETIAAVGRWDGNPKAL